MTAVEDLSQREREALAIAVPVTWSHRTRVFTIDHDRIHAGTGKALVRKGLAVPLTHYGDLLGWDLTDAGVDARLVIRADAERRIVALGYMAIHDGDVLFVPPAYANDTNVPEEARVTLPDALRREGLRW